MEKTTGSREGGGRDDRNPVERPIDTIQCFEAPASLDAASAYLGFARDFLEAAEVLHAREPYSLGFNAPVMLLVSHAIEIGLKGYLRFRGFVTREEWEKAGKPESGSGRILLRDHDLQRILRVARSNGFNAICTVVEDEERTIDVLNVHHVESHFKYPDVKFLATPNPESVFRVARKILDALDRELPATEDRARGE